MQRILDNAIPAATGAAFYGLYRLLQVQLVRAPQRPPPVSKEASVANSEPEPFPEPQEQASGQQHEAAVKTVQEPSPVCRCGVAFAEEAQSCERCGSRRPEPEKQRRTATPREGAAAKAGSSFAAPAAAILLVAALFCLLFRPLLEGDPARSASHSRLTPTSSDRSKQTTGDTSALFSDPMAVDMRKGSQDIDGMGETLTIKLTRQVVPMTKSAVDGRLHYKSAYWGTLSVGTPAIAFKVVVDTGSGHVILPSTYCHSSTCRSKTRYRRSSSSTGRDIDVMGNNVGSGDARDLITVSFGTGEVEGVFMEDVVCLGGDVAAAASARGSAKAIANGSTMSDGCMPTRMIVTTDMTEEPFDAFEFDGILGLGLQPLSQSPEFNFMRDASKKMFAGATSSMFAIHLSDDASDSEVTFGGWKPERVGGGPEAISWNPVIHPDEGHWLINIKSVRVGDTVLKFCRDGCKAVTDTGTSLLAVPSAVFPELFTLMAHKSTSGHCKGPGPLLHIELENTVLTLGPKDWARLVGAPASDADSVTGGDDTRQNSAESDASSSGVEHLCNPTMMTMDLPEPLGPKLFILGEPVIRRYYAVFDPDRLRVGFGPSRD